MTWLSSAATVWACLSISIRAPGSMGTIFLSNWGKRKGERGGKRKVEEEGGRGCGKMEGR